MYYLEIKSFHSIIAYFTLVAILVAIIYIGYAWLNKKPFSGEAKIIAQVAMGATHIQFLMGIILYIVSPLGLSNASAAAMQDSVSRLYMLEHPLMMLMGVIFISIGFITSAKLSDDKEKQKKIVVFYSLGLLFILSRIPWNLWI